MVNCSHKDTSKGAVNVLKHSAIRTSTAIYHFVQNLFNLAVRWFIDMYFIKTYLLSLQKHFSFF